VREFCEYWRSKNLPDTAAHGDTASDENAPVVKVSKRKVEAKIREIAVYELRPQSYKQKLWYVNDETLDKLNLCLPVPTEWKWITLVSAKSTEANAVAVAKQSDSVASVHPSPTTAGVTIKAFMTPNGSHQNSKDLCAIAQSPSQMLQQSTPISTLKSEAANSASPACIPDACDNGAAASSQLGTKNPVRPHSRTPCSASAAKKHKVQSSRHSGMPVKKQSCLLFSKKAPNSSSDSDCMVIDSSVVDVDKAMSIASAPCAYSNDDNDCMIIDSSVADLELGIKSYADRQHSKLCGDPSDVYAIGGKAKLSALDDNCNLSVESSGNDANKPADITGSVDE